MGLTYSSTAGIVLRARQEHALAERGIAANAEDYEQRKWKAFEDIRKQEGENPARHAALATTELLLHEMGPFQNPDHLFFLVRDSEWLVETARLMGPDWELRHDFMLGSAYTARISAETYPLPQGKGSLIVFDDGLFVLASVLGSCFSLCYSELSVEAELSGRHDLDHSMVQKFFTPTSRSARITAAAIAAYASRQSPRVLISLLPPWFLTQEPNDLSKIIVDTMIRFPLAHELGHLHEGHVDEPKTSDSPRSDTSAVSFDWLKETQADWYGSILATRTTRWLGAPWGLAALAVELCQVVRILVSQASHQLQVADPVQQRVEQGDHAPPDVRLLLIRDALDRLASMDPAVTGVTEAHRISDAFLHALRVAVDSACEELPDIIGTQDDSSPG